MAAHIGNRRAQQRVEREKIESKVKNTKSSLANNIKSWLHPAGKHKANEHQVLGVSSDRSRHKPYTDREMEAAIKLGRFVSVRKRLKDIARQRKKVQHYIRAIFLHLVFTIIYVSNIWVSDEERYYSVNALREMFVYEEFGDDSIMSLPAIITVAEMYDWMDSVLVGNFYGPATFDNAGDDVKRLDGLSTEKWLLGGVFRKVGGIRIGTIRANKLTHGCNIKTDLFVQNDTRRVSCYEKGPYSHRNRASWENMSDFGNMEQPFKWAGWNGTDTAARRAEQFTTQTTYRGDQHYYSPAYSFVLPQTDSIEAARMIKWAKENQFVDYSTRAVIVDSTVLNGQTNQIITMRFIFSFSGWGGVVPYHEMVSVDPDPIPILTIDFANLVFSDLLVILEVIFYVYFVFEHVYRMVFEWCHYEQDLEAVSNCKKAQPPINYIHHLWNDPPEMWQLVNMFFYSAAWTLRIQALWYRPSEQAMEQDGYVPLRSFTELTAWTRYAYFPTTLAIFFRMLYFMAIVPRFGVITSALSRSIAALLGWLFVYLIQAGMWVIISVSLYGTKLESFRSTQHALMSIMQMSILGENIIPSILEVDGSEFSWVFIILFYLINTLMLLNMMIAIISDAYVDAKEAMETGNHPDVRIGREIYRYFMLKIWKIPLVGSWFKSRYINYGLQKKNAIHRKITKDMSLHQQLKAMAAKERGTANNRIKNTSRRSSLGGSGGFGSSSALPQFGGRSSRLSSKYAVMEGENIFEHDLQHNQRIAKTAAQQTLKELRSLAHRVDSLVQSLNSHISTTGGAQANNLDDFLFHQKQGKGGMLYGSKGGPHFVLDGQPGLDHSVVGVTQIGHMPGGRARSNEDYGVL